MAQVINKLILILELIILISIIIEDEKGYEISIYKLVVLFIVTISKMMICKIGFSLETFILANALYGLIFLLAKGNFGLGDVILNGIIALNFSHPLTYFRFFTLTFCLGSILSLMSLYFRKQNLKSRIAFAKFIVIAYIIESVIGGYFV